ncbi:MAG: hypothetical protein AAF066_17965 [Pseudomonadota bacterium]
MSKWLQSLFAVSLLWQPAHADTLPHLRLDLPLSVEELEDRFASARQHVTPIKDRLSKARARHQSTVQSAMAARSDAWFEDPNKAAELREGCSTLDQDACVALAHLYLDDSQTLPDEPLAYSISLLACEVGHDAGCELFADHDWSYYLTEYERLFPATAHFYNTCADGNAGHCRRLGYLLSGYHSHRDIELDAEKGQAFFRLACDMGSAEACKSIRVPELPLEDQFAQSLRRCNEGDAAGCYSVGHAYVSGRGVEQDVKEGLPYLENSCASGHGFACRFRAKLFETGQFMPIDKAAARSWHDKACSAGEYDSCKELTHAYENGLGVPHSPERAQSYRDKSCEIRRCAPVITAQEALAQLEISLNAVPARHHMKAASALPECLRNVAQSCHEIGVLLQQHSYARPITSHACDLGHGPACSALGRSARFKQGLVAFQRSCDLGHLPGCTYGTLVDEAMSAGARQSRIEALCSQNEGYACLVLGHAYAGTDYRGGIVPIKDNTSAAGYYQQACDAGELRGCTFLATLLDPERFADGDLVQMMRLLEQTCDRSGASACRRLGDEYRFADRVARDFERARGYYARACLIKDLSTSCPDAERLQHILERRDLRDSLGGFKAALVERPQDFQPYFQAPARRIRAACAAGQTEQCIDLGLLFETYEASPHEGRDMHQARAIYLHLCGDADREACFLYGESHKNQGHESRHDISLYYFQQACDLGHGEACASAAFFYELGDDATGGEKDDKTAGTYYMRACSVGNAMGCDGLSSLFGVSDRTKSAFDLIACLGGDGQACGFIASDYRKGRGGVPKHAEIASRLYAYGCALEDEGACYHHNRLGGE